MKFLYYLFIAAAVFVAIVNLSDYLGSVKVDLSDVSVTDNSEQYTAYYDQLTDYQKKLYDSILEPVSNGDKKISISSVNVDEFVANYETVAAALQYDHPEYFWFSTGYYYQYPRFSSGSSATIVLEPAYYSYASAFFDFDKKQKELDAAAEAVAQLAREHSADAYEQLVFVHDYIIENSVYDHDALESYYSTSRNPSDEYIFSAYGCLVNKRAVCSGYAKAFQIITCKLGYKCSYVVGSAGESHAWNCIYIGDDGYFVDVTWDDIDRENEEPLYNYAFITNDALQRTHTIDMPFSAPSCTQTLYNYFRYRGYYSEKFSLSTTASILRAQADNDAMHIQYGSLAELKKACAALFEKGELYKIGVEAAGYICNEDHYTITFLK